MGWLIGGAIVLIIFLFSRRAGAVVVALLAVAWVGFWLATDRKSEQEPSNQSVSISANSDPQLCPNPDMPVSVRITNHADRALETVSFSLVAKQRNSIVYRASHTSGEAIAPGDTFSTCYGLNPLSFAIRTVRYDPRELDWTGETSLTRFASP
ncbi:hypothetical protein [Neorhizobium tomejilense]|uniref:hypothetical protein n=1 Tax=Neorhizobium tomejilense TaxID=2093828 RepID=UPI000CF88038|nr:hypothetical protein [Neorhizobium tomejilense]